jgi:TRAP-type C4-dicarboxylate transport system substrate-binding protein
MDPAFYSVEANILVNLDKWKSLTDAQRKVLTDAALWVESLDSENDALIKSERERQAKAGIETLDFGPAASEAFLKKANDAAWQAVITKSPENGKKLRELAGN